MQVFRNDDGSFCIHKIAHITRRPISAWYNSDGTLRDAEYMVNDNARAVSQRETKVRARLAKIGKVWARV